MVQDGAWLALLNEHRCAQNLHSISDTTLERLLDRLEKEAFLAADQSAAPMPVSMATDPAPDPDIDADAVCSICLDDESQVRAGSRCFCIVCTFDRSYHDIDALC